MFQMVEIKQENVPDGENKGSAWIMEGK